MSYARISGLGVSGEINVSAVIQGNLPPIPGGLPLETPKQTFDQILASSPELQQVQADWGPSMEIAGKLGISFDAMAKNPNKAVEFMMGALPTILQAAGIDGSAVDIAAVAAGFAPQVGALTRGHPGPLIMAGIKTGAAYGCKELGIPPDIGNITIDAIASGELTDKTLVAAGGLGGAIGGSAICSLIGVPPCIGGYIGGFTGKLVGGALASTIGIGGGKAEREQKKKEREALLTAINGQLESIRAQYVNLVALKRGEWWSNFDHIIDNIAFMWQSLECNFAYAKFPLLWSGRGAVNPYFLHPFKDSLCARPINRNLSRGTGCLDSKGFLSGVEATGCPEPYGCRYPSFPALGGDASIERVVQAFAAYDIWWVPPSARAGIDQQWLDSLTLPHGIPNDPKIAQHMRNKSWLAWMSFMVQERQKCTTNRCKAPIDQEMALTVERFKADLGQTVTDALSLEAVQAAAARIAGDLTTTAGVYAAAAAINMQSTELIKGDLSKALARSKADQQLIISENAKLMRATTNGRRMNKFVNYAMLAAGGIMLGGAVAKTRRR